MKLRFIYFLIIVTLASVQAQSHMAAHIIVPQARSFALHHHRTVNITQVDVGVTILEQVATVKMDISLYNPTRSRLEAELMVPIPAKAVIRGFTFQGAGQEPTAKILPKAKARSIYDAIVAKTKDPALLEFVGYGVVRSSVFPVEARGKQKVRLIYEHLLSADNNRVDFILPRSESIDYRTPWNIAIKIATKKPISTVYSPTHKLQMTQLKDTVVLAQIAKDACKEPGSFRLSYLLKDKGVSASLFSYPDPKAGGGYFLLLAGVPDVPQSSKTTIKREVILVIDHSGSMRGEKMEQVREAARQIIGGLREGEAFNILIYNQVVESFARNSVTKNKTNTKAAFNYLKGIMPTGGTNIHDALVEALRMKPVTGTLPIVLFLTDGLPTIGQTSEIAIRKSVDLLKKQKRVFTFGVGVDVNTPLLESIASTTRSTATFVLPKEDVEVKVGQVFQRLTGPVLAFPQLEVLDKKGKPALGRVQDIMPKELPDLFQGDQLVLLGRYIGEDPIAFAITGNYLGKQRRFHYSFNFSKATTRNAFVTRLWASRKIANLIDEIRKLGADSNPIAPRITDKDVRLKELVGEVVRLSTEFGILTEYTAFLAREGTDLSSNRVLSRAEDNFKNRAWKTRTGLSSVNQEVNAQYQKKQKLLNRRNEYWNDKMSRVGVSNVQQINDRTFYRRGGQWVDSRVVQNQYLQPQHIIHFGSKDFNQLIIKLVKQGRQGCISLKGDIVLVVDGKMVLVTQKLSTTAKTK